MYTVSLCLLARCIGSSHRFFRLCVGSVVSVQLYSSLTAVYQLLVDLCNSSYEFRCLPKLCLAQNRAAAAVVSQLIGSVVWTRLTVDWMWRVRRDLESCEGGKLERQT